MAISAAAAPMLAGAMPASAATSSAGVVDSGSDWTVTQGAGGYTVSVTLPSALPVRNDIPVLVADDTVLGAATESSDGLTLSINTTNAAVATASDVTWEWSSGGDATGPTGTDTGLKPSVKPKANLVTPKASMTPTGGPILTSDPTEGGTFSYTTADYNFGAQAMASTDLNGVREEVQGRIYLPSGGGEHPLVVFMHGRHSTCYVLSTLKSSSAWPCPAGDAIIPSYAGYDAEGDALASHGITVVSIGANAINANDGVAAPDGLAQGLDAGADARGQEILDTLTWLQKANLGQPVSFLDTNLNQTVTLDQALAGSGLTANSLVGTMDFNDIGIGGHSRGGEGAATAASLNAGLAHPWDIKSDFLLAPIDFTRDTVPDVDTATLLPYCDGDVSDQQGEHFYADSKGGNVFDSDVWIMGTDHDFYNTAWTPPTPGASDDWTAGGQSALDPECGEQASGTSRLSPADEAHTGAAYVAGFFELTLQDQNQFASMFNGTGAEPPSVANFADGDGAGAIPAQVPPGCSTTPPTVTGASCTPTPLTWAAGPTGADVRTVVTQPSADRDDITSFAVANPLASTTGNATATVCANAAGRTVPVALPACTFAVPAVPAPAGEASTVAAIPAFGSSQEPYWTPASDAPNVPLNQMTHLTWTAGTATTTDKLGVNVPTGKQDVSSFGELTVNMSPDQSVVGSTDMTLSVTDSSGHTWSAPLSTINKWTVTRMPGSGAGSPDIPAASSSTGKEILPAISSDLGVNGKLVLQQAHVATSTLAAAGLDLTHITNVSFTVVDPTTAAGEYLQDLTFDTPAVGSPDAVNLPTANVASTKVEEGSGPHTDEVAAYLDEPSTTPVTAYVSIKGSTTGTVGLAMQPVTFPAGVTCETVQIPVTGNTTPSANPTSVFEYDVSDPGLNAVLGLNDYGLITVREDDGVTGTVPASAPFGVQGDACAEFEALSNPGTLTSDTDGNVAAGNTVTLTGHGYRSGESVTFTLGTTTLGSAIADANGNVTFTGQVSVSQPGGLTTASAVGLGSGFTSNVQLDVVGGPPPALPEAGQIIVLPLLVVLFGVIAYEVMRRRKRLSKTA